MCKIKFKSNSSIGLKLNLTEWLSNLKGYKFLDYAVQNIRLKSEDNCDTVSRQHSLTGITNTDISLGAPIWCVNKVLGNLRILKASSESIFSITFKQRQFYSNTFPGKVVQHKIKHFLFQIWVLGASPKKNISILFPLAIHSLHIPEFSRDGCKWRLDHAVKTLKASRKIALRFSRLMSMVKHTCEQSVLLMWTSKVYTLDFFGAFAVIILIEVNMY